MYLEDNRMTDKKQADLLRAMLEDCRQNFAQLFVLMEQGLKADPLREASQALAFEKQIEELMQVANVHLGNLRQQIFPWDERRAEFSPELVEEVDQFLALLEEGLQGIEKLRSAREVDVRQKHDEIRKNLEQLNSQREGLGGYKQKVNDPKIIQKKV